MQVADGVLHTRELFPGLLEFGLVADVLFTAVDAGYRNFDLLVSSGDELGMLAVTPTSAWFAPDADLEPTAPVEGSQLDVTVQLDAIELSLGDRRARIAATSDCTRNSSHCLDREALMRTFSAWGAERPTGGVVHVHVDRAVPYQVLVTLLPLLRGERCAGPRLDNDFRFDNDPNCSFWLPSIDSNPPLYRNIGATIVLGEPEVRRFERTGKPRAPTPESTVEAFVRNREAIRTSLIADRTFMRGASANAAIHLIWGPRPMDREPAFVVSAGFGNSAELNTCIARQFDAVPLLWNTGGVIGAHWLELKIPYQLLPSVE